MFFQKKNAVTGLQFSQNNSRIAKEAKKFSDDIRNYIVDEFNEIFSFRPNDKLIQKLSKDSKGQNILLWDSFKVAASRSPQNIASKEITLYKQNYVRF